MIHRILLVAATTLASLLSILDLAPAQTADTQTGRREARPGEIDLRYSFHEGDTTRTRLAIDSITKASETISDASWIQRLHQEFVFGVRISAVTEEGVGTIEMTIESLKMSREKSGEDRAEFDSTTGAGVGGKADGGGAGLGELVGRIVTMVVAPDGSVREMRGVEHLARAMTAGLGEDEESAGVMQGLVRMASDDSLKSAMESGLRILPGRPVRRGESWTSEFSQNMPIGGVARSVWKNRLASIQRKPIRGVEGGRLIARIESVVEISLGEPDPKRRGAHWVELAPGVKVSMNKSSGSASTIFDATAGKVTRSELRLVAPIEVMVEGLEGPKGAATLRQELDTHIVHEEISDEPTTAPR